MKNFSDIIQKRKALYAYALGAKAFSDNDENNPYDPVSSPRAYKDWENGWLDAKFLREL